MLNTLRTRMSVLEPTARWFHRMEGRLRAFAVAENGAAAIFFVLSAPVWLGGIAFGAEVGSWYYYQQKLQSTADLVAVSVAGRAGTVSSQMELNEMADNVLAWNWFDPSKGTRTVAVATPDSPVFVDGNIVNVQLTQTIKRYLTGIFTPGDFVIRATASAQVTMATQGCILSLRADNGAAITLSVGGNIQVTGCEMLSNGFRFDVGGGSNVVTDCARSRFYITVQGSLNVACRNGQPEQEAGLTADPYADLPDLDPNMFPPCNNDLIDITSSNDWTNKLSNKYLAPDGMTYVHVCANVNTIKANAVPKNWVLIFDKGAILTINDGAPLLNSGPVMFYFTGGAWLNINAPSTRILNQGPLSEAGMIFRGSRSNVLPNGVSNSIIVGPNSNLNGAIYFPASPLDFMASGSLGGCPQIIASTIKLSGTWQVAGPCARPGVRPIVASRAVRLTQ